VDNIWVDQQRLTERLTAFFGAQKDDLAAFGRTVNQTFEAFVFAQVVSWYRHKKWEVKLVPPKDKPAEYIRLKFSTRGRPANYTHARCTKGKRAIQIRHGLRVATRFHRRTQRHPANVVLDVAVIKDLDVSSLKTYHHVENEHLVTFGEAKHMSAFAELVANFIGLVHEMLPERVARNGRRRRSAHPRPFLYASGRLYSTAEGIRETIAARDLDIEVYDHTTTAFFSSPLPIKLVARAAPPRP
jgi:hypothetical protein